MGRHTRDSHRRVINKRANRTYKLQLEKEENTMRHLSDSEKELALSAEYVNEVFEHIHFLLEIEKLDEADINFEKVRNMVLGITHYD